MVERMTVLKGVAAVVGLLVVSGGALGAYAVSGGFEQPTVESVDVRWGEVTADASTIRATITVNNPNAIGVPGLVDIVYTASLNDVVIAEGEEAGVGLSPGRNRIELAIPVRNDQIPPWWVTHINRGESSTLAIEAAVRGPLGLSVPLPAQEQPVETDILGSFSSDESTEVALFGQPVLVLGERTAEWGEASAEATPVTFRAQVSNRHDHPVTFDGVGYVITMNDVTMGEGEEHDEFTVAPGETETLKIRAALETEAIDDWWISHLERDETTALTVETYAIVEGDGDDPAVELDLVTVGLDLQTDLLGGGGAGTSDATTQVGAGLAFEAPGVEVGGLSWGEVTDDATELDATVELQNPNADSPLNQLVDLTILQRATINDVLVADDETTVEDLPTGSTSVTVTATLDNSRVPEWWARHVNDNESSTIFVESTAAIDLGVTTFDLRFPNEAREFDTNLLADMNGDRNQVVTVGGSPAATVVSTSAAWGRADAQETPIDAAVTLRNDRPFAELTVSDVAYTITMNEVTVADGTDPASVTVGPGETGTLRFRMVIDSTTMSAWWVSHVRNDEVTTVDVQLTATVEVDGETEQVTFDFLGDDVTMETDILGAA